MTRQFSRGTLTPVRRGVRIAVSGPSGVGLTRDVAGNVLLSVHHVDGHNLVAVLDDAALDRFSGQLAELLLADPRLAENDR